MIPFASALRSARMQPRFGRGSGHREILVDWESWIGDAGSAFPGLIRRGGRHLHPANKDPFAGTRTWGNRGLGIN